MCMNVALKPGKICDCPECILTLAELRAMARKEGWYVTDPADDLTSCEYGGLHGNCLKMSAVFIEGYNYCKGHGHKILSEMLEASA